MLDGFRAQDFSSEYGGYAPSFHAYASGLYFSVPLLTFPPQGSPAPGFRDFSGAQGLCSVLVLCRHIFKTSLNCHRRQAMRRRLDVLAILSYLISSYPDNPQGPNMNFPSTPPTQGYEDNTHLNSAICPESPQSLLNGTLAAYELDSYNMPLQLGPHSNGELSPAVRHSLGALRHGTSISTT